MMKPSPKMLRYYFLRCAVVLFAATVADVQPLAQIKIEEGTQVRLKLMESLHSGTAQPGQTITFEVLDDVKVGDFLVIAQGATAWGSIVEAEQKKSLGRGGKLGFTLDHVKAVDGTKVSLRAQAKKQGEGKGMSTGIAAGAAAVIFWPAAPFFLLRKGKDIEIPKGFHVDAFVDGDKTILLRTPAVPSTAVPAMPIPSGLARGLVAELGMLNVTSNVAGAEVQIDGNYYGNAPSQVKLTAGMHSVTVTAPGYGAWTRTLQVTAGSALTAHAALSRRVAPRRSRR